MLTLFLAVAIIVALLLYIAVKPFSYWSKRNVKTGKVTPIFGDNLNLLLGKESFAGMIMRMYNKVPDARYIGCYQFQTPCLVVKSTELIKQICVKNFDCFLNHRTFVPENVDDLLGKNLFALKGLTWKNMRSTISPSFTSSKMRAMFELICENAEIFVEYFLKKNESLIEVDMKDIFSRYSIDVIASSAFGYKINSLEDKDNEFYKLSKEAGSFGSKFSQKIVFFVYQSFPKLASLLKLKLFSEEIENFFMTITRDNIKSREEQNIKRPDMLGLLLESRKKGFLEDPTDNVDTKEASFAAVQEHLEMKTTTSRKELTDREIAGQLFLFFFAGFEAVSTAMCFMAYELAVNPDVQEKLIQEIDENRPKNGRPSYETIVNMTYLDMVLSETLRKWPIAVAADRVCTKPYTIEPELSGEEPLDLDVGEVIFIPIFGLHRDPKIYENPEKFDPERFSMENRNNIDQYAYLPFGIGPRNCIGSRYALLKIKAVLFFILSHFEIVPIEKTQIPLEICKKNFNLFPEKGFHLGLKRRYP